MATLQVHGHNIPIRAILFDKDGTLLDFLQLWGQWAELIVAQVERHLDIMGKTLLGEKSKLIGTNYNADGQVAGYDKTGPVAMGSVDEVTAVLAWQLYVAGIPWNEAVLQVRQFNKIAMEHVQNSQSAYPMPGLIPLLDECLREHIQLAVVTSDDTANALEHLRWLGIDSYFTSVFGHDRVLKGKPDPEMVYAACTELGVRPEEVVVIGDSNADMQMGKLANVKCTIGIAPDGGGEAYLLDADVIIQSYKELLIDEDLI